MSEQLPGLEHLRSLDENKADKLVLVSALPSSALFGAWLFNQDDGNVYLGLEDRWLKFTPGLTPTERRSIDEIVRGIEALTPGNRLSYTALDDTPTIPPGVTLRTAEETARLLETLVADDRLDASAIKNLVDGGYTTPAQLVAALQTLIGDARLDASAIKNLPTGPVSRVLDSALIGTFSLALGTITLQASGITLPDTDKYITLDVGPWDDYGSVAGTRIIEVARIPTAATGDDVIYEANANTLYVYNVNSEGNEWIYLSITSSRELLMAPGLDMTYLQANVNVTIRRPSALPATLRTAAETARLLETLAGAQRLDYLALKNQIAANRLVPAGGGPLQYLAPLADGTRIWRDLPTQGDTSQEGILDTELYNQTVDVVTPGVWVNLGISVPTASQANWLLCKVSNGGWFIVSAEEIRSVVAGVGGTASAENERAPTEGAPDLVNPVFFGRAADGMMLFTMGVLGEFAPTVTDPTLRIRRIKAVSGEGLTEDDVRALIPPPFDIHDSVTTAALPDDGDRFIFSSELTDGDPMRYSTFANLRTRVRRTPTQIVSAISALAGGDRLSFNVLKDVPTFLVEEAAHYIQLSEDGDFWVDAKREWVIDKQFEVTSNPSADLETGEVAFDNSIDTAFVGYTSAEETELKAAPAGVEIEITQDSGGVYRGTVLSSDTTPTGYVSFVVVNAHSSGAFVDGNPATVTFSLPADTEFKHIRFSRDGINWTTYSRPAPFDIHDDVPVGSTSLQLNDRFIFSAENEVDDPMRYATLTTMRAAIRRTISEVKTAYEQNANTNAFTDALLAKLNAIENSATADQTGAEIVTLLEALTSGNRLSYNALDDVPAATALRTAAETARLLETLTGTTRLQYSAVQNGPQLRIMEQSEVSYTTDQQVVFTTTDGAEEQIGEIYVFQYRQNLTRSSTEVTISVNGSDETRIRMLSSSRSLRFMTLNDITRFAVYMVLRVAGVWQLIGQTLPEITPPFDIHDDVTTGTTSLQLNDRFILSAENETGDPMRYATLTTMRTAIRRTISEVKTAYEQNADTNAFTNALLAKLNGIEANANATTLRTADQTARLLETLTNGDRLRATAIQGLEPGVYVEFSSDGVGWYNYDRQLTLERNYETENADGNAINSNEVYIVPGQDRISISYDADQAFIDSLDTNHHIRLEQGTSYFEGDVTGNSAYGTSTDAIQILMENIMSSGTFVDGDAVTIIVTLNAGVNFGRVRFSDDNVNWTEFQTDAVGAYSEFLGTVAVSYESAALIDTGISIPDNASWLHFNMIQSAWRSIRVSQVTDLPVAAAGDPADATNTIDVNDRYHFGALGYAGVKVGRTSAGNLLIASIVVFAGGGTFNTTIRAGYEGTAAGTIVEGPRGLPGPTLTGPEIVALLEALTSGNRLSYTALDDTPTIPPATTLRTAAETARLLETLTDAQRLAYSAIAGTPDLSSYLTAHLTGPQIVTLLEALTSGNRLSYTALDDTPTIPPPTPQLTGPQIVTLLEALTTGNRLSYTALDDRPTIPAQLTGAQIVALLEALTSGNRLSYTALDDTPTIPPATTLRTAEETARLLETLMGADRFSYNSLKDLPTISGGVEFLLQYSADGANWFNRDNAYVYDREYEQPDVFVSNVDPNEVGASSDGSVVYLGHSAAELTFLQTFAAGDRIRIEESSDIFTEGVIESISEFTGLIEFTLETASTTSMGSFTDGADVTVALTPATAPARTRTRFSINNSPFVVLPPTVTLRTGSETADLLEALAGDDRLQYSALRGTPDLSGYLTDHLTGPQIVTLLEALSAGNRLSYNRLDDTPTIPAPTTLRTGAETADLLEGLTGDDRLLYTALRGVPDLSGYLTAHQSGADIVTKLEALTGDNKLLYSALRNVPDLSSYLTEHQTGAEIVTKLEAQASGSRLSYNRLDDRPDLSKTTPLWSGQPPTQFQHSRFVRLQPGGVPATSTADYVIVRVEDGEWKWVSVAAWRALTHTNDGQPISDATALPVDFADLAENCWLGRGSQFAMYWATSDTLGNGVRFRPDNIEIRIVNKS